MALGPGPGLGRIQAPQKRVERGPNPGCVVGGMKEMRGSAWSPAWRLA